jgi:hypothetical protein
MWGGIHEALPLAKTGRLDAVTFTGHSGKGYAFRIYVWNTQFKPLAGVYLVASRTIEPGEAARYQALFVGTADDMSSAIAAHPRSDCFAMYYANVIGVLKEEDTQARERIAADLVASLSPPCNADDAE